MNAPVRDRAGPKPRRSVQAPFHGCVLFHDLDKSAVDTCIARQFRMKSAR
jgi:hypothetical protein